LLSIVKFATKFSHPIIGSAGRICLNSLKPDQHGTWKPSPNLTMVLTQIWLLLTQPNIGDPLGSN
jgi:ubiquitin-protein ligase